MIDVIKACELATKERKESFVDVITDIGHSFVIGTKTSNGEVADVPPCMINKESGNIDICFIPDYFEELEKGSIVEVPKDYKYFNEKE